jgi:regulator of cell morphogenesis and NO signaling
MTITETTTVGEIASIVPSAVRLFQRHGIDFCCGGRTPLSVACRDKGMPFPDVVSTIQALAVEPRDADRDWTREPLDALTDHIVATYHDPLREELPRLEEMASKVAAVHGAKDPRLARLRAIVTELGADLRAHMQKEERVLFPAIRAIERGGRAAIPLPAPIAVMEHEHDHAGALLTGLRLLTEGYTPPDWACGTLRALYHGLAELESTMHVHVHLENNVLFPRALDGWSAADAG